MKKIGLNSKQCAPVIAIVACAAAILVSYCGKKEDTKVEAKFSSIYSNVIASCAKCHVPGNDAYVTWANNLDLSSQSAAYTSLTSAASLPAKKPSCDTTKYVVAGNPATSLLWAVLDNTTREAFSEVVPGCDPIAENLHGYGEISADARASIKQWITEGAQNN